MGNNNFYFNNVPPFENTELIVFNMLSKTAKNVAVATSSVIA
jgi:hypothetical protein